VLTEEIKYSNMILSFKERHNHWELSEESHRKGNIKLDKPVEPVDLSEK
jgi:hypothetical protein